MEVPVVIHDNDLGSREHSLTIHVQEKSQEHNALSGKRLKIQITDPSDPFFYFVLVLSEEDFQGLKQAQELLVDFAGFPAMIHQLLTKCRAKQFSLMLQLDGDKRSGGLKFQEISQFRALSHLTLKLHRGSDAQIKDYLAECIRQLQSESSNTSQALQNQVHGLEAQVQSLNERLKMKSEEFDRVKQELLEKTSNSQAQLSSQLASEKERAAQAITDIQNRYEQDRRKMAEEHAKNTRHLENRIAALEYENKDLTEKKHKHEALIHRLNEQVRNSLEENQNLKRELETKKFEHNKLDSGFHDRERILHQLRTKLSMVEQERDRLQSELTRQTGDLNRISEQKVRCDQELSEKMALVTKRENAVKAVSQELVKANEIIRKFQNQVKVEHQKVKLTGQILKEQEKVMDTKEQEIHSLRNQLKDLESDVNTKQLGLGQNELTQKKLQDQIEDLEKKLRTNETLIHWLNKQLTTAQARDPGLRLTAPPRELGSLIGFTPSGMNAISTPMDRNDISSHAQKENAPTGIDEKYLQSTLRITEPNKGLLRQQTSAPNLPSNVRQNRATSLRNAGILKKTGTPSNDNPQHAAVPL